MVGSTRYVFLWDVSQHAVIIVQGIIRRTSVCRVALFGRNGRCASAMDLEFLGRDRRERAFTLFPHHG